MQNQGGGTNDGGYVWLGGVQKLFHFKNFQL